MNFFNATNSDVVWHLFACNLFEFGFTQNIELSHEEAYDVTYLILLLLSSLHVSVWILI